jgi:hypothetical protein
VSRNPRCVHVVLEDRIHEFIFKEVSNENIDEFMEHFERLLRETPPEATLRLITQNGDNPPQPMAYALARTRTILRHQPTRPKLRAALVENSRFAWLLDAMFQALITRRDRLRVFHNADRENMLDWLRRDD